MKDAADPIDQLNPAYAGQLGAGRINAEQTLLLAADSRPISSLSIIRTDNVSEDKLSEVNEYSLANFQAFAYYTDGTSENVTNSADWTVRPTRYARFDPQQPGHLLVYQVPADREITITAMYTGWNLTASTHMLLTIKNINLTQEHSGLIISSADNMSEYDNLSVYEGQSINLAATFVSPDNVLTNVTNASGMVWELISGKGFARLDAAIEAVLWGLVVDQDRQVTIKGTYRNREAGLLVYDDITVTVQDISAIAGLSITGPQQITSGNSAQFNAKLVYTSDKEKDLTKTVVWDVDTTAASFMDLPRGELKVGTVTGTIYARISATHTVGDDKSYTAYLDVKLLPTTVAGETYQQEDQQPNPGQDQPPEGSIIPNIGCPAAAVALVLIMGMGLALLTKPSED